MERREIENREVERKGLELFWYVLSQEFWDMVRLNLLFALACLPVVTIPAAYCAMTRIVCAMVRREDYDLWEGFWKAFKGEFKGAWLLAVPVWGGMALSAAGVYFYGGFSRENSVFLVLAVVALLLLCGFFFLHISVFPMQALLALPVGKILKNGALLAVLRLPANLLALFEVGCLLALALLLAPASLVLALLVCPSLLNLITTLVACEGLEQYKLMG